MSAGDDLRAALAAALDRESAQTGQQLRFDAREQARVDAACRAADAVEALDGLIGGELAGENRGSLVVKYLAERRLQDAVVAENLGRLAVPGFAPPSPSPQHQAAGAARWAGSGRVRGRRGVQ